MVTATFLTLSLTAITIAFLHTAAGPDHYLPFIVLRKSRGWSLSKTILLTITCGFGHVFSSILLGIIGVFLGWQMGEISFLQDIRGNMSSWALLIFGVIYLMWGLWQARKVQAHKHFDVMQDNVYVYEHKHGDPYTPQNRVKVTPLVLFAIFVMGPSEPIIPLLFFSGTHRSPSEIAWLIALFTLTTIVTMVGMVLLGNFSYNRIQTEQFDRFSHAIGGFVISMCAFGMLFLGW
ncbi:MAG: sulfite exporter TauE/SafE family protein [Rikenellaceae bacterium]